MKRLFVTGLLFVFMAVAPVVSAFTANLPSGYTELEYIESTGTQYIDTGYKPKTGDKIRIVYQYNSLYGGDDGRDATSIFGCTDAASATTAYNGVARVVQGTNTINRIAWGNGTNSVVGNLTYNNATGVWYDLVCDNGVFTINDTQLGTTSANPFSANFSMYLFARNTGGTAGLITKGKIQIAQIWDNGTLVRNFVPAKNSSGVVGMYDTVGNRFYTNQGTGEFTGGRAVCPNGELAQTYTSATGTVVQNGTPTPTNPIEPVFYTQGNMVLRKVGDYADSYDSTTGKITRRVGVKVLDGMETGWGVTSVTRITGVPDDGLSYSAGLKYIFSHFNGVTSSTSLSEMQNYDAKFGTPSYPRDLIFRYREMQNVEQWRNWLAQQYAAGTPVTVYYPLATPVEENWPSSYCAPEIKIATTAYNTARFNSVKTDLNNAVATIREIVTKTINQTAAIASLQADKQTRPEDACPAGKKCLLVETEENGVIVPHWFPIIEAPE